MLTPGSRQVDHLTGGTCLKTPQQCIFQTRKEFDELRSLRNSDGGLMRIYFRETNKRGYLTSLSAIGDALLRRAEKLKVKGISSLVDIQKGSLELIEKIQRMANA
jgi:hypothetical protein